MIFLIVLNSYRTCNLCHKNYFHRSLSPKGAKKEFSFTKNGDELIIGKLHLRDFPTCVYFLLKDDFRKKLIRKCTTVAGLDYKGLSKHLGVPYQTLLNWKAGRRAVPIQALWRMVSLLQVDPIISNLDENVTAYKMKAGKSITNPNLPIIFDERVVMLLVHLMADDYVADGQMPSYCNYNPRVLKDVKNCLLIFGNVPVKERYKKKGKEILIPTVVLKLMNKFFGKVQFGSHKARIPRWIQFMSPSVVAAAIRAFADDEATVLPRCIRFYSANSTFLSDIRSLLIDKFSTRNMPQGIPESSISPITKSTGRSAFYFSITSKGLKPYRELIGFTHTEKRSKLAFWVDSISTSNWHHNPKGVTRRKILEELRKEPKTVKELSETVRVNKRVINDYFLKRLAKEGLIASVESAEGRGNLWVLESDACTN